MKIYFSSVLLLLAAPAGCQQSSGSAQRTDAPTTRPVARVAGASQKKATIGAVERRPSGSPAGGIDESSPDVSVERRKFNPNFLSSRLNDTATGNSDSVGNISVPTDCALSQTKTNVTHVEGDTAPAAEFAPAVLSPTRAAVKTSNIWAASALSTAQVLASEVDVKTLNIGPVSALSTPLGPASAPASSSPTSEPSAGLDKTWTTTRTSPSASGQPSTSPRRASLNHWLNVFGTLFLLGAGIYATVIAVYSMNWGRLLNSIASSAYRAALSVWYRIFPPAPVTLVQSDAVDAGSGVPYQHLSNGYNNASPSNGAPGAILNAGGPSEILIRGPVSREGDVRLLSVSSSPELGEGPISA